MTISSILSVDEVREYISDYAPNNYLIDGEEMTDTFISLCMTLAVDGYNTTTPRSRYIIENFPSKTILLLGTCWQMYLGKATLLARNTMNYSDGGLQIPIEERAALYQGLSDTFRLQFAELTKAFKIQQNMECGWGSVSSDESMFPQW